MDRLETLLWTVHTIGQAGIGKWDSLRKERDRVRSQQEFEKFQADSQEARTLLSSLIEEIPDRPETTLFINRSDSRCGYCNKGAFPEEKSHITGAWSKPGCGARFTSVASDYGDIFREAAEELRPDLDWEQFAF